MKGVGPHWGFLVGVVIVVIIVGVSIILVTQVAGIDITKYFGLEPVLGVPAEITLGSLPPQVGSGDTPESDHIVTAVGDPYQPSDLGCAIADLIFNDYKGLGDTAIRPDFLAQWDGNRGHYLVGAGTFILGDTLADPGTWETGILAPRGCHYCGEPVFDEVCINYNLMDRIVGAKTFCDGGFSTVPTDGSPGDPAKFGNAWCVEGDANSDSWKDRCDGWLCIRPNINCLDCDTWCCQKCDQADDYCDNELDKARWIADKTDGDPANRVRDHRADDDRNKIEIEKTDGDGNPIKYFYGVIWDKDFKEKANGLGLYHILFVRVPQDRSESNFDWIEVDFKDWLRNNRLGFAYQYARMVSNVTVTGANKNEFDLREEIATNVVSERCSDEVSCLASDITTPDSGSTVCYKGQQYEPTLDMRFKLETVKFKTNICNNANLRSSNTYKVKVTNWYGKADDCYSLLDRTVGIYCTDCCNDDNTFDPLWESVDCADYVGTPC